jgi:hypothetical protein
LTEDRLARLEERGDLVLRFADDALQRGNVARQSREDLGQFLSSSERTGEFIEITELARKDLLDDPVDSEVAGGVERLVACLNDVNNRVDVVDRAGNNALDCGDLLGDVEERVDW